MSIDPRTLLVFQSVARHGSLTGAADALNMTQPAITKAIKRLESQVGAELLIRHARGVTLTPLGSVILPYSQLLASELNSLEEQLLAERGMARSTLRLGVLGAFAASLLPSVISRLMIAAPQLSMQIVEGIDDVLLSALRSNEIDVAIVGRGEISVDVQVALEDQFGDVLSVVAARDHPLASMKSVKLEDMLSFPWVLPPSYVAPVVELHRHFIRAGLQPPEPKVETRSTSVIHALVASTNFLSWQPSALILHGGHSSRIVSLDAGSVRLQRQFFVLRRKGVLAPAARVFLASLRAIHA